MCRPVVATELGDGGSGEGRHLVLGAASVGREATFRYRWVEGARPVGRRDWLQGGAM